MGARRLSAISALAAVLLLAAAPGAAARDAGLCARLKSELAGVSRVSGSPASFRRYDAAVRRQEGELRRVHADLRRLGCSSGSIVVFGGSDAAACGELAAIDGRMRANLRALERQRDSFARRDDPAARQRLLAAIEANGCNDRPDRIAAGPLGPAPTTRTPQGSARVAVIDGRSGQVAPGDRPGTQILLEPRYGYGGNLRTLCVRTCDGFYFPISSAATAADFGRDQRTCAMMCPGVETELFYHGQGQESEDMVSAATHVPYSELPNAFRYRSAAGASTAGCSCNMKAYYEEMKRREALFNGKTAPAAEAMTGHAVALPTPRPDRDEEAETSAGGRNGPDAEGPVATADQAPELGEQKRPVRVVGPAFLPSASEKLDLTSNADSLENLFR